MKLLFKIAGYTLNAKLREENEPGIGDSKGNLGHPYIIFFLRRKIGNNYDKYYK